jgi:DNA polymerase III epsilon subunit-like protein
MATPTHRRFITTTKRVVFFDLETTTGSDQRVIEFGAAEIDVNTLAVKQTLRMDIGGPEVAALVTAWSQSINHISADRCSKAVPFAAAAARIAKFMDGAVWCGHNIRAFDIPKLRSEFDRARLSSMFPTCLGMLDTLDEYRRMRRSGAMPVEIENLKLATVAKHTGLGTETHTALEDAVMAWEALCRIADMVPTEAFSF